LLLLLLPLLPLLLLLLLLLLPDDEALRNVVWGADVRRISIGFEPNGGGRPKTPWLFHERLRWSSPLSSAFLNERFNLSTRRLWNLFRELELPVFGGDEPVLLLGDCRELWEAREDVREK
jgi:hypothetical protein